MYHHTPQAPLTETTSLIYHYPVYCFKAERDHLDGWPSSKVQGVCVCVFVVCVNIVTSHDIYGDYVLESCLSYRENETPYAIPT